MHHDSAAMSAEEADLNEVTFDVALVVLLQQDKPRWKIASTEFGVFYYADSPLIAALAQRAKRERRRAKVGCLPDKHGQIILHSMVLSGDAATGCYVEGNGCEPPEPGFLF